MIAFIVRRLIAAVGLLLIVTLATFVIFFVVPQWGGQTPQSMAAGVLSAVRKGSLFDRLAMFTALLGVAMPVYFVAPLAMLVLVYKWPIFPVPTGLAYVPFTQNPFEWAAHLLLVWLAAAFIVIANLVVDVLYAVIDPRVRLG